MLPEDSQGVLCNKFKVRTSKSWTRATNNKDKGKEKVQNVNVADLDPRTDEVRVEPSEVVVWIHLQDKNHGTKLGTSLE